MTTSMIVIIAVIALLVLGFILAAFREVLSYVVGFLILAGLGYGAYLYFTADKGTSTEGAPTPEKTSENGAQNQN